MAGFFTTPAFSVKARGFSLAAIGAVAGEFAVVEHLFLAVGIEVGHVGIDHAAGGALVFDGGEDALDVWARLDVCVGVEGEGEQAGGDEDVPVVGVHGGVLGESIVGVGAIECRGGIWSVSRSGGFCFVVFVRRVCLHGDTFAQISIGNTYESTIFGH